MTPPKPTLADRIFRAIDDHTESIRLYGPSTASHSAPFKTCKDPACAVVVGVLEMTTISLS